ncbi:uncharacterized protein Z519_09763 [Cladophialophora bantiana CBS 173.52]|uniref:Uncharacterized protein n=1 Tax=Cladophialophora bantiana (strain ATCC 10958 / CBS 173.52 / CDC B-1940 / NIH 8579) TaxID=1442370 RepID=A0A0D2FSS2_CLAB1|nr:uncharacterized protein Z519_09763 [Cladophialophora bantiana CBS 173.52]KIW89607.1 hypothetical protein Z519_09763 [Cladophialophora bantiana CBS 173.52]
MTSTFAICEDVGKYWVANNMPEKIINTASLASFIGNVRIVRYAMSQGGVAQLTKALNNEWAAKEINVNAIAPGHVLPVCHFDCLASQLTEPTCIAGRWGTPEDFKGSSVFLTSSASDYIHGQILLVSIWDLLFIVYDCIQTGRCSWMGDL